MTDAPKTVQQHFEEWLSLVYPDASDMDEQQRSDLRDFYFAGARLGLITALNARNDGPHVKAITGELAVWGRETMLRMATPQGEG